MKTITLLRYIVLPFFIFFLSNMHAQQSQVIYDCPDQSCGSLTFLPVDNQGYWIYTWDIPVPADIPIKINYAINIYDVYLYIYYVNTDGTSTHLMSGTETGQGSTPTFVARGGRFVVYAENFVEIDPSITPFSLSFASDSTYSAVENSFVNGDAIIGGNLNVSGQATMTKNLSVGSTDNNNHSQLYVYKPHSAQQGYAIRSLLYGNSSSSSYGICSNAYNSSGPVYGIYSVVGGSNGKKWSGYFAGGDVEVDGGKLKVKDDIFAMKLLAFHQNYSTFTVTSNDVPGLTTPFLMPKYGVAAPNSNGTADLFLSGDYSIRMFTAGNPAPKMTIMPGGNVGIGTITPQYKLDINGKLHLQTVESISGWNYSYLYWNGHSLIMGSPVGVYCHNSIDLKPGGVSQEPLHSQLRMYTSTNENQHTLNILLNSNGNCFFNNPGRIGIGTSNPQYKLDVKGTIRATEVKVESVDNFPDYVFSDTYRLRPLSEVDEFIKANGRLPEIPSAQDVKENGIGLMEMNKKLLKKVEELTLYIIEQQKQIDELKKSR